MWRLLAMFGCGFSCGILLVGALTKAFGPRMVPVTTTWEWIISRVVMLLLFALFVVLSYGDRRGTNR